MKTFQCHSFDTLSNRLLYRIMQLRQEVFVLEQDCNYLDADGLDPAALHLTAFDGAQNLLAYARILPPGVGHPGKVSIGRVVSPQQARGQGWGKDLMRYALTEAAARFPGIPVRLSAQTYLIRFYEDLGFRSRGSSYLEDGIPHREMELES